LSGLLIKLGSMRETERELPFHLIDIN